MILSINGRDFNLIFGLTFLREINKLHSAELEGMKTGYGAMTLISAGVAINDPLAFVDIIKAGTITAPQKPSDADIEAYLADLIDKGKYKETIDSIIDELKASSLLKLAMNVQE